MRSKIFREKPKTVQTALDRWVQIIPAEPDVYRLFDPVNETELGRILFDMADYWVYDGRVLAIEEQEDVAGAIGGHQKEMEDLFKSLL